LLLQLLPPLALPSIDPLPRGLLQLQPLHALLLPALLFRFQLSKSSAFHAAQLLVVQSTQLAAPLPR
jgi:hypothetical protein